MRELAYSSCCVFKWCILIIWLNVTQGGSSTCKDCPEIVLGEKNMNINFGPSGEANCNCQWTIPTSVERDNNTAVALFLKDASLQFLLPGTFEDCPDVRFPGETGLSCGKINDCRMFATESTICTTDRILEALSSENRACPYMISWSKAGGSPHQILYRVGNGVGNIERYFTIRYFVIDCRMGTTIGYAEATSQTESVTKEAYPVSTELVSVTEESNARTTELGSIEEVTYVLSTDPALIAGPTTTIKELGSIPDETNTTSTELTIEEETNKTATEPTSIANDTNATTTERTSMTDETNVLSTDPGSIMDETNVTSIELGSIAEETNTTATDLTSITDDTNVFSTDPGSIADDTNATTTTELSSIADETNVSSTGSGSTADETSTITTQLGSIADEIYATTTEIGTIAFTTTELGSTAEETIVATTKPGLTSEETYQTKIAESTTQQAVTSGSIKTTTLISNFKCTDTSINVQWTRTPQTGSMYIYRLQNQDLDNGKTKQTNVQLLLPKGVKIKTTKTTPQLIGKCVTTTKLTASNTTNITVEQIVGRIRNEMKMISKVIYKSGTKITRLTFVDLK